MNRTGLALASMTAVAAVGVGVVATIDDLPGVGTEAADVRQSPTTASPSDGREAPSRGDSDDPDGLLTVPRGAVVKVPTRRGTGNSDPLEFSVNKTLYTVAVVCDSPSTRRASIRNYGDPAAMSIPVKCDGAPSNNSIAIASGAGRQRIQFRAPSNSEWTLTVYEGTPDSVSVKAG